MEIEHIYCYNIYGQFTELHCFRYEDMMNGNEFWVLKRKHLVH